MGFMSTHENTNHSEVIVPGSDRSFGLVVGGILTAIGIYQFFAGSGLFVWVLGFGVALMLGGVIAPRILHPLNIAWTRFGLLLGKIITPIVMFLVFVISVVPTGLILRLMGKDLLRLKLETEAASYWIERTPPGPPPESLKDQF